MELFTIKTHNYPSAYSNVFLTQEIYSETNGILYLLTGPADTQKVRSSLESKIVELSKKFKIDLTTQLAINVGLNQEGKCRGFTIIYIANPITYCVLIGKDPGGQDIIQREVDNRITNQVLQKMKCKSIAKVKDLDHFDDEYDKVFYTLPVEERYVQPYILTYNYTESDLDKLGEWERKKQMIIANLGKITIKLPKEQYVKDVIDTCLHTKAGDSQYDLSFFKGLFNIFPEVEITVTKNDTFVNFKSSKSCYFASMLYKNVKVDNHTILTFSHARQVASKQTSTGMPMRVRFM